MVKKRIYYTETKQYFMIQEKVLSVRNLKSLPIPYFLLYLGTLLTYGVPYRTHLTPTIIRTDAVGTVPYYQYRVPTNRYRTTVPTKRAGSRVT